MTSNNNTDKDRARHWCFTYNNYQDAQEPRTVAEKDDSIRYIIWQAERGANGTPHLQGYIEFRSVRRFAYCRKIFPSAHWEVRYGNRDQAREYCRKDDSRIEGPWECGEWSDGGQGGRSDIHSVKRAIDNGATESEIADQYFDQWVRYHRAFREYKRIKLGDRCWKTIVTVLCGKPGTGKSLKAHSTYPGAYWKQRSQWWDGYDCHETVIIDDFYGWLPFDVLLRICDRYPLLVETKGGQTQFVAKNIIITSNNMPIDWYNKVNNFSAFIRRVDEWWYFNDDVVTNCGKDYALFVSKEDVNKPY